MSNNETVLSKQEKNWILNRRFTRLTDNKEIQIYPMGAERYLASMLLKKESSRYNITEDVRGKNILIIPGHGNSAFLFAEAGAKRVTVYDKDPVTIAWVKAFKKYYHFRGLDKEKGRAYPSVGEILQALTRWYPPLLSLPYGKHTHPLYWLLQPNTLRRTYLFYMVSLVIDALQSKTKASYEFDQNIQFHVGTIEKLMTRKEDTHFDTMFLPYLLGVKNGIETEKEIVHFMKQAFLLVPKGRILVTPARSTKEFYLTGKRYFVATSHKNIQSIPGLDAFFHLEDRYWFRTQGLVVFEKAT